MMASRNLCGRSCSAASAWEDTVAGYAAASPSAAHLAELWVAVRAAVRGVLDEVNLEQVVTGRLPAGVRRLVDAPGAWQPR